MRRLLVVTLLAAGSLAPAATAYAGTGPTTLPIWSFFDLLVDHDRDQIYISQGRPSHAVIVTDLNGQVSGQIDGLFDPHGMALSEDGSILYVAQPTKESIALVDPDTLQVTGSLDLPAEFCPGTVAVSGQYIVAGIDCDHWGEDGFTNPPSGGAVLDTGGGGWLHIDTNNFIGPHVTSSPGDPGTVLLWDSHHMQTWDVTGPAPTFLVSRGDLDLSDAAITPDGSTLILATREDRAQVLSMPDLNTIGTHATLSHQRGIAMTPDGTRVATATDDDWTKGIRLHNVGEYRSIRRFQMEDSFVERGLGIDANAKRIYAIGKSEGPFLSLHVFPGVGWPTCDGRNPTIVGTAGDDTIVGTRGDDVILARGGNDRIDGRGGNDTICGGPGDDLIEGGDGDDVLAGGAGSDTVTYEGGDTAVDVNLATRTATGQGTDEIRAENVIGTDFDDTITGSARANVLVGGPGADTLRGGDRADALEGGLGDDTLFGGPGRDVITSGAGGDRAVGGAGQDKIIGDDGNDQLIGGRGADIIKGGDGYDVIRGGPGTDTVDGGRDGDATFGGAGADTIDGGEGDDLLVGGNGDDSIVGSTGNDTLAGEQGDDTLEGGPGVDTASFAVSPDPVVASIRSGIATGEGADTMTSIEWLVGSPHGDTLIGDAGNNLLDARGGDDDLTGAQGDDFLQGGDGTDILRAGMGDDLCAEGETMFSCEAVIGLDWDIDIAGRYLLHLARGAHLFSDD